MSELQDYLNSMSSDITDDVAVSERFVDKKGNLLKFKIKSMSYDDYGIRKNSGNHNAKKGKMNK